MKDRIISIDVFRGMTIFLMIIVNTPGSWSYVYPPLLHAKWHGCTLTDLVFPFFLFIVGITLYISYNKIFEKHADEPGLKSRLLRKTFRRAALIFLVGLFLNWFPFHHLNISDLRIMGVLQRIALSFAGAALLILFVRGIKGIAFTAIALLLSYWFVLYYFGGTDPYSLESNIAGKFDVMLFGETHVYNGFGVPFDPEGLLGTISGIAHVLIGYLVGSMIINANDKKQLMQRLITSGVGLIILGLIWNSFLPINKPLWTSSYVVYTCGIASLVLATLILIIDILKIEKWSYIFKVFGLNPLFSYALSGIIINLLIYTISFNGTSASSWIYENIFQSLFGNHLGSFLFALDYTMLIWLIVWPLYRKKIVIKI